MPEPGNKDGALLSFITRDRSFYILYFCIRTKISRRPRKADDGERSTPFEISREMCRRVCVCIEYVQKLKTKNRLSDIIYLREPVPVYTA